MIFSSRSSAKSAPVVDGAGQTGNTLATRGWTPDALGVLLADDRFQLGAAATTRLHKALLDVDADATGRATLEIWPSLRESPTDGAPLVVQDAKGLFALTGIDHSTVRSDRNLVQTTLSLKERLPVDDS